MCSENTPFLRKKCVTYAFLCAKICAMDTIASISTPMGTGAIAIVRMSGKQSLDVALGLFENKKVTKQNIVPRMLYLGNVKGIGEKCLMVYFKGPHSFTGEDMVEFQVHGGVLLCQEVLRLLLENGARLAENGEFSKRAFLNGKISLDEAEGIIDVIEATHKAELSAGFELLNGRLLQTVKQMQQTLTTTNARLAVTVDYPEYDDEVVEKEQTKRDIKDIKDQIEKLLANSEYGKQLKTGVKVALVGKPNVGKSSILNAVLGENRAIVTDIAGTTRDSISEQIVYKGIKMQLVDTAGLREGNDLVEKIGIDKTKQEIKSANLVVFVVSNQDFDLEDERIYSQIKSYNPLVVQNKSDVDKVQKYPFDVDVRISALQNENITEFLDRIVERVYKRKIDNSALVLTNTRHIQALKEAFARCDDILQKIDTQTVDIVLFEIKSLWSTLGKITGESENEKIIDEIFSRFCLGK